MAHRWAGPGALVCAVGLTMLLGPLGGGTAWAEGTLKLDPEKVEQVPGTVTVTGQCPGSQDPDGGPASYPSVVRVELKGFGSVVDAPIGDDGAFSGSLPMPTQGMPPGGYTVEAYLPGDKVEIKSYPSCDDTADFVVLPALALSSDQALAGDDLRAEGTCPADQPTVELFLEGEPVGAGNVDGSSRFADVRVDVPVDTAPGKVTITSSCDADAQLEVLPPPVTISSEQSQEETTTTQESSETTAAGEELVTVPDLIGKTEQEARAGLDGRLLLAVDGAGKSITTQSPAPGERVAPGTTVTAVLGSPDSSALPLVAAGLVGAAAVATPMGLRARRTSRERRRVRGARYDVDDGNWRVAVAPDEAVPSVDLHLEVELNPRPLHAEERDDDRI